MITGICAIRRSAVMAVSISAPFRTGIMKSRNTKSGGSLTISSRPCRPLMANVTS